MKKIVFSNLLLLVLLLALVLVIWIDPFSERDPAPVLLTDVDTGTIKTISLRQSSELHFSMEKRTTIKGDFWWLTAPIQIPADKEKVKQILDLLHTNSLRRYQIKSANLVKLGLDPPSWEIALDQVLVKFGKTEPIEQRRYVLVGATVHLINDRFSQYNFGSPLMLANLDILPVDKSVTEIHLPDKVIKKVDGQWQSSPSSEAISQNSLNEFIDDELSSII